MVRRSLTLTAACLAATAGTAFAQMPNVISNIPASTISADGTTCYVSNGGPVKTVVTSTGALGTISRSSLGPASDNGGALYASSDGLVLAFDGYVIGPNAGGIYEGATCVQISTDNGATWTPMPLLPDQTDCGSTSSVWDVSPDGRYVVGGIYVSTNPCGGQSGFVFDRVTNTVTRLSDLAPWGSSATGLPEAASFNPGTPRPQFWANSVSGDGSVVVGYGNPTTPVVWDRDGMGVYHPTRLTSSVAVGGSQRSYVSRDGTTIVGVTNDLSSGGAKWTKSGGVWTASAIPLNITSVPNNFDRPTSWLGFDVVGQRITPTAISADASVITGSITYEGEFGGASGLFMWTAATGTVDLFDYALTHNPEGGIQAYSGGSLAGVSAVIKDNSPAQNIVIAAYGGIGTPPALFKFQANAVCYAPTFFRTLNDQEISSCNTSIFMAPGDAAGTGPFGYVWYKDNNPIALGPTPWGSNITNLFGSSLSINNAQSPDAGQYFCRAMGAVSGPCNPGLSSDSNTMTLTSIANPVPNDVCLQATNISALPYTAPAWDVCRSTLNNIIGASCVSDSVGDVWFKYTPATNQAVRVSMCGNNFDSVISVYTAGPGTLPNGADCTDTEIACNDTDSSFNCSINNFNVSTIARLELTGGQTYMFRAAGKYLNIYDPYEPGAFSMTLAPEVPANDNCAGATEIPSATLPVNTVVNNLDATTEITVSCDPESGRDIWFKFTPSVTQDYRLSTCGGSASDPTENAPFDTVLSVHSACGASTEIACNNNQGYEQASQCTGAITSRIERVTLNAGTLYYIRVASAAHELGGAFGGASDANLNISVAPPFPANDLCANAQIISTASPAPYVVAGVNNGEASTDEGSGSDCAESSADIWYSFTPNSTPANGWRIQICGHGYPWNTLLSVHSACVGSPANQLACNGFVGGNAPPTPAECDNQGSRIDSVALTQGLTYYIRVASAYGRGSPTNTGTLTIGPAPATPVNDVCAGAINAAVGTTAFDLTEATPQTSAVEIGCDTDPNSFTPYSAQDVWFTFNPPCTTTYSFMVCGSYSPPTDIDPILHVYSACSDYPTLPPLACNNDITTPYPTDVCSFDVNQRTARISDLPLTAGVPVRVRVAVAAYNLFSANRPGSPTGNLLITAGAGCDSCCRGTTCNTVASGTCTGAVAGSNSVVVGACTGNTTAGCCFADFNHVGGVTIDDLFLYLNAYFTNSPYANFGGDTIAGPTIDDLFLYINAYFTGCS